MFLENQKDWKMWLPILQFALNDAVSASTGETPHKATFGINRKNVWIDEKDEVKLSEKLRNLHNQISMEIKWNHEQAKRYFDKRRVEAPNLKRGDRVYLRRRTKGNSRDNIFTKKESSKLDMILLGPFEIKKVLEFDNYELWLPPKMRIHPVFHISLLKPTENEPTKEDMELDEFEVEKLVDKRVQGKQTQYRVRWKGFEEKDDTWEPRKNLNCPEKVQEFEEQERSSEDSKAGEPTLRKLVLQENKGKGKLTNHQNFPTEIARKDRQNQSARIVRVVGEALANGRTLDGKRQRIDRRQSWRTSSVVGPAQNWKSRNQATAQTKQWNSLIVEDLGEKKRDRYHRNGNTSSGATRNLSIETNPTKYSTNAQYRNNHAYRQKAQGSRGPQLWQTGEWTPG